MSGGAGGGGAVGCPFQSGGAGRDGGSRRASAAGAALLVVVGASAALAVLVSLLLLSSLSAYEASRYAADLAQARLLAAATAAQVGMALRSGTLPPPGRDRPRRIVNGAAAESAGAEATAVPVGVYPPGGEGWPPVTGPPVAGREPVLGVGSEVTLRAVLGPRGDWRGPGLEPADGRLVDAAIRVWFRRAESTLTARFLMWDDGRVERLD